MLFNSSVNMLTFLVGVLFICWSFGEVFSESPCSRAESLVCGEDWITYINECYANKAKKKIKWNGPCPPTKCRCNRLMIDVCGSNGMEYSNPCVARCHGVTQFTMGKCDNAERQ
ncbi:serine protease inhibitor dipetalogastin-like [Crassostrea angulata]|uniref:serine protease inhibitor dipetalogastin-like n=1 Tax=Magallana angulata TaxID=2784310 RepID=UPI0005C37C24|nr:serine protease inhibitor dipetalogastin-like [Crassostrea angulata]